MIIKWKILSKRIQKHIIYTPLGGKQNLKHGKNIEGPPATAVGFLKILFYYTLLDIDFDKLISKGLKIFCIL